jgi:tetratricopeptide (TPR) repeat protein
MIAYTLSDTQYRLARHYLDKLRQADEAVCRGQANVSYGLKLFDQEWEQIQYWQAWAAKRGRNDETSAQLCKEFPLAGLEILANRNNAADQALWFLTAMEAAQQLRDCESERILCYQLFMTYRRLGMLDKVEYFASQLLKLGEATNDRLSIERALLGFGFVAEDRGMFAEAESYYQHVLQLSTELCVDTEIAQALNGLGTVASYLGEYQKAYPFFLRQLELMEATGKKSQVCHALLMMGHVLLGLKEYPRAESYLQRAVNMGRVFGFQRLVGVSLLHLGSSALEQNQLEIAYDYTDEGLRAVRRLGVVRQIMSGLSEQGYILLRMGDLPTALARLQEGLQLARESGRLRNICDLQCNLANTYLALNDLDTARSALHEALTLAQRLRLRPEKVKALSIAVAYDLCLGRYEQAAVWAGSLLGNAALDGVLVAPIYVKLERVLGTERYHAALQNGQALHLDDVVDGAISVVGGTAHQECG